MSLNALPTNRLTLAQQMQAHTSKHPPPKKKITEKKMWELGGKTIQGACAVG